ncbi:MAG: SMP-30/gluconolactonase/LRE family protein [Pseudomonadales bacterium]
MKQMDCQLIATVSVANTLGEGIIWHAADKAVWWTDIQQSVLYRYNPESEVLQQWQMPERVGCFAFIENDSRLMVAFAAASHCMTLRASNLSG